MLFFKRKSIATDFGITVTHSDYELGSTTSYGISYMCNGKRQEINDICIMRSDIEVLVQRLNNMPVCYKNQLEKIITDYLDEIILITQN